MNSRMLSRLVALSLACSPLLSAQQQLWSPVSDVPGDLVTWEAEQRAKDATIQRTAWVQLDVQGLRDAARSGAPRRFALDLFDRSAEITIDRTAPSLDHTLFRGTLGEPGEFLLALNDATPGAAAEVILGDEQYTLSSTAHPEIYALRERDSSRVAAGHRFCGTDAAHLIQPPAFDDPGNPPGPPVQGDQNGLTTIDWMVLWTRDARVGAGSRDAIRAEIVLRVGRANDACTNSNVGHFYRLVYAGGTDYNTSSDMNQDLRRFRGTNDGYLDWVHALRASYGADLMALITEGGQYCGIAYLMSPSSQGFAPWAFGVTARTCLPGNTLHHEAGHNMGCAHDRQNASGGAWPYSFGYRTPDARYRTVMAYSPGARVNYWSNPGVSYNGYPMGTANDNNGRGLDRSAAHIAGFSPTRTLEWCNLGGGIPGRFAEPTETGSGTINNVEPITLTLGRMVAGAPGVLVIGTRPANTPLFGGTLTSNVVITIPLTGSATDIPFDLSIMSTLPTGADFYFQSFFVDPTAVQGISASDGLKTIIP